MIAELQSRTGFTWEKKNGRYRDNVSGRFIAEKRIIEEVTKFDGNQIGPNIEAITKRMTDGRITVAEWQSQMKLELKNANIVNAQAGRGGRKAMTQADYGRQGGRLGFEYRKVDQFAADIVKRHGTDQEMSVAAINARAQLYANGPRTAMFDGMTAAKKGAGFTEERRVLGATEHCAVCVGFAAEGWQPIGHFPEPGTRCLGMHLCGCDKLYRK